MQHSMMGCWCIDSSRYAPRPLVGQLTSQYCCLGISRKHSLHEQNTDRKDSPVKNMLTKYHNINKSTIYWAYYHSKSRKFPLSALGLCFLLILPYGCPDIAENRRGELTVFRICQNRQEKSSFTTSHGIAVNWHLRVYWLLPFSIVDSFAEHRRFFYLAPTTLLLSTDDSFT